MGEANTENRRMQPRYALISDVKYFLDTSAADELDGRTLNVSSNGLCLAVRRQLEVGNEIVIKDSLVSILRRRYKVKWVKKNPERDDLTYMVGLTSSASEFAH